MPLYADPPVPPFTAGTVYTVTDDRLRILGGWYADLTTGTHLLCLAHTDSSWVFVGRNTRTGQIVYLRGEQWVRDHLREVGALTPEETADRLADVCRMEDEQAARSRAALHAQGVMIGAARA